MGLPESPSLNGLEEVWFPTVFCHNVQEDDIYTGNAPRGQPTLMPNSQHTSRPPPFLSHPGKQIAIKVSVGASLWANLEATLVFLKISEQAIRTLTLSWKGQVVAVPGRLVGTVMGGELSGSQPPEGLCLAPGQQAWLPPFQGPVGGDWPSFQAVTPASQKQLPRAGAGPSRSPLAVCTPAVVG